MPAAADDRAIDDRAIDNRAIAGHAARVAEDFGLELHHEPPYRRDFDDWATARARWLASRRRRLLALPGGILAVGLVAAGAATAGLLTGGGAQPVVLGPATPAPVPSGPWAAAPPRGTRAHVAAPVFLNIPAIGVRTGLIQLGLTTTGALQVPDTTAVAGWYTGSARPGALGAAVIAGHVDSRVGPGVFFHLRQLKPGNRIFVRQASGTLAVFRVNLVHEYRKTSFPTLRVYGPQPTAQLRLITCGGTFDSTSGSYLSNVIVYATLIHR